MSKRDASEYLTKDGELKVAVSAEQRASMATSAQIARRKIVAPKSRLGRGTSSTNSPFAGSQSSSSLFGGSTFSPSAATTQQPTFGSVGGVNFGESKSFPTGASAPGATFNFESPTPSASFPSFGQNLDNKSEQKTNMFGSQQPSQQQSPFPHVNGRLTTSNPAGGISFGGGTGFQPSTITPAVSSQNSNSATFTASNIDPNLFGQNTGSSAFGQSAGQTTQNSGLFQPTVNGNLNNAQQNAQSEDTAMESPQKNRTGGLMFGGGGLSSGTPFSFSQPVQQNGPSGFQPMAQNQATGFRPPAQNGPVGFGNTQPDSNTSSFNGNQSQTQPRSQPLPQSQQNWFNFNQTADVDSNTEVKTHTEPAPTQTSLFNFNQSQPSQADNNKNLFNQTPATPQQNLFNFNQNQPPQVVKNAPLFGQSQSSQQPQNASFNSDQNQPPQETHNIFAGLGAQNAREFDGPAFTFGQTLQTPQQTDIRMFGQTPSSTSLSSSSFHVPKPPLPYETSATLPSWMSPGEGSTMTDPSRRLSKDSDISPRASVSQTGGFSFTPLQLANKNNGDLFNAGQSPEKANTNQEDLFSRFSRKEEEPKVSEESSGDETPKASSRPAPTFGSSNIFGNAFGTSKVDNPRSDTAPSKAAMPSVDVSKPAFGGFNFQSTTPGLASAPSTTPASPSKPTFSFGGVSKPTPSATASQATSQTSVPASTSEAAEEKVQLKTRSNGPASVPSYLNNDNRVEYDKTYRLHSLDREFQTKIIAFDSQIHDFGNLVHYYVAARENIGRSLGLYQRVMAGTKRKVDGDERQDDVPSQGKKARVDLTAASSNKSDPAHAAPQPSSAATYGIAKDTTFSPDSSDTTSSAASIFKTMIASPEPAKKTGIPSQMDAQPKSVNPFGRPSEALRLFGAGAGGAAVSRPQTSEVAGVVASANSSSANPFNFAAPAQSASKQAFSSSTTNAFQPAQPSTTPTKSPPKKTGFAVPNFGAGSSVNFMDAFAKQSETSTAKLAAEAKAKRKAEEFDSDEDDEAEWERNYAEKERAKRNKVQSVPQSGFDPSSAGKETKASTPSSLFGSSTASKANEQAAAAKPSSWFTPFASSTQSTPFGGFGQQQPSSGFKFGSTPTTDFGKSAKKDDPISENEETSSGDQDAQESLDEDHEDHDDQDEEVSDENYDPDDGADEDQEAEEDDEVTRSEESSENDLVAEMQKSRNKGKGFQDRVERPPAGKSLFDRIERPPARKDSPVQVTESEGRKSNGSRNNIFGAPAESSLKDPPILQRAPNNSFKGFPVGSDIFQSTPSAPKPSPFTPANGFGVSKEPFKPATTFDFKPTPPTTAPTPLPGASVLFGGTTRSALIPGEGLFGSRPSTPVNVESSITGSIFGNLGGPTSNSAFGSKNDFTRKPGTPIKFGTPDKDSGAPAVNITAATPPAKDEDNARKPFTSLFGENKSSTAKLASGSGSNVGFGFGFGTPAPGFLGAASHLIPSANSSAVSSRANSPGLTDNESVATNDTEDLSNDPQTSLMTSRPGEELEEVLFEARSKALKYYTDKMAEGTKMKPRDYNTMGLGVVRVLKNKDTGKTRVVFRAEPGSNIVINSNLLPQIKYESDQGGKSGALKFAMMAKDNLEKWVLKLKTKDMADEMAEILEKNKT